MAASQAHGTIIEATLKSAHEQRFKKLTYYISDTKLVLCIHLLAMISMTLYVITCGLRLSHSTEFIFSQVSQHFMKNIPWTYCVLRRLPQRQVPAWPQPPEDQPHLLSSPGGSCSCWLQSRSCWSGTFWTHRHRGNWTRYPAHQSQQCTQMQCPFDHSDNHGCHRDLTDYVKMVTSDWGYAQWEIALSPGSEGCVATHCVL